MKLSKNFVQCIKISIQNYTLSSAHVLITCYNSNPLTQNNRFNQPKYSEVILHLHKDNAWENFKTYAGIKYFVCLHPHDLLYGNYAEFLSDVDWRLTTCVFEEYTLVIIRKSTSENQTKSPNISKNLINSLSSYKNTNHVTTKFF